MKIQNISSFSWKTSKKVLVQGWGETVGFRDEGKSINQLSIQKRNPGLLGELGSMTDNLPHPPIPPAIQLPNPRKKEKNVEMNLWQTNLKFFSSQGLPFSFHSHYSI